MIERTGFGGRVIHSLFGKLPTHTTRIVRRPVAIDLYHHFRHV